MKYEYKRVSITNGIDELNKQGQDGWRVVTLVASVAIMERVVHNDDTKPASERARKPKLTK